MFSDDDPVNLPAHKLTTGWADLTVVPDSAESWAHSGLVVTSAGELIGFHAGRLVSCAVDSLDKSAY
jgi:hypothetical protein